MMDGRWTLLVNRRGEAWVCDPDVSVFPQTGEALTPVVPCDDAAVERAVRNVAGVQFEASEQATQHAGILVAIVVNSLRGDAS